MTSSPISVVICAYSEDRWRDLTAAVQSVMNQETPAHEIIVVVDHNPALADRVRACLPDVRVFENSDARGLSGARNTGVRASTGEIVAFLDDDAVADRDWLSYLSRPYADPRTAGSGGSIEPAWEHDCPAWFPDEFNWVIGCTYRGMPTDVEQVRNVIGANMSFRRELFNTVGGFRNGIGRLGTLPVGCEETEFCIRVFQHDPDAVFVYEPRARIRHRVPRERGEWGYFTRRCYAEGRSKALVSKFVGPRHGLSSEWKYTTSTLPRGVLRGLSETMLGRERFGALRATAIVAGLTTTTAGFILGHLISRVPGEPCSASSYAAPSAIVDTEKLSTAEGLTVTGAWREESEPQQRQPPWIDAR